MTACLALLWMLAADGAAAAPGPLWFEAEAYWSQRGSSGQDWPPLASQGECLGSDWGGKRGHEAAYRVSIERAMNPATLWIRYARQPAEPARWSVSWDDRQIANDMAFATTGGWGHVADGQWRYVAVPLGPVAAGWHTLKLVSLADKNNTNLDGFFLAEGSFQPPATRKQIENFARAKVETSHEVPGPDCIAKDLTLETFSGRCDDWYYPAEEAVERRAAKIPAISAIDDSHATLEGEAAPRAVAPGEAYGPWRLAAILPGTARVAVLEREWDRWGLIVYAEPKGVVAEIRKAVGRLESMRRPQVRYPLDYFERLLAARDDVLGAKVLARGEATYAELAGCLAPLETYTFFGVPASEQKFIVQPNGALLADPRQSRPAEAGKSVIFDPVATLPKLEPTVVKRGLLGGWLPAVDYGFYDARTKQGYELCALADEAGRQALVRARSSQGKVLTFRTPPLAPVTEAEFFAELLRLRSQWNARLAGGMQIDLPDRRAADAARACLARALSGCPGDHPKYGMGIYWGKPMHHDGFPPTTLSLNTCLLDWGLADEAKRRLGFYLDRFVKPDGTILYYGPAVAEYGELLDLVVSCARRTGDWTWLARHRPAIDRVADYLVRLLEDARQAKPNTGTNAPAAGLIVGAAEADTFDDRRCYFSGNAWCWRGLWELGRLEVERGQAEGDARLSARGRQLSAHSDRLRADLATAVAASIAAANAASDQKFVPPAAGCNKPFQRMTESTLASYTNYRYWLETLSAECLRDDQERMILDYRLAHGGELLGMTRFSNLLDDWPYYHHAWSVLAHDRVDRYLLGFWGHVAHHQTQGTFTAYEGVPVRGWRERTFGADYCVPSELTAPLMLRWMLAWESRNSDTLWLCRAAPRAWFERGLSFSGALTRWGPIGLSVSPCDAQGMVARIALAPGARPSLALRVRHPERRLLVDSQVTGARHNGWDPATETLRLTAQADQIEVRLSYGR